MPKRPEGEAYKPRRCKCCKLVFVPQDKNPANAIRKKFCTKKCKDGYHRNGGMNIDRLAEVLARRMKPIVIETVAAQLRHPAIELFQEIQRARDMERMSELRINVLQPTANALDALANQVCHIFASMDPMSCAPNPCEKELEDALKSIEAYLSGSSHPSSDE